MRKVALKSTILCAAVALGLGLPSFVHADAEMSSQQKIQLIAANYGKIGSGDQMRRFFFKDLEPIGVQPGGAGHVVNLYNKETNTTFSYCSSFDVVVASGRGKIANFPPEQVK